MSRRLHASIRSALVLLPVSVITFVFLFTFAPAVITRAARYDSGSMDFVVGVDGNISIMLPKNDISFMIDASRNEVASQTIEIGVDSNLTHGVVLGMTTAYSNMSSDDITGNGLNSVHSYTIPALDSTVHKSLFPTNHWGYSVDGGNYYSRMPAANDGFMAQVVIEDPSSVDMQEIYIGAKADISQPLDYYYTTINFTAITNFAAKTIDDIIYMQEMTPEVVESMETNRQYRLRDSRDKKDYWIAKFDDGNVWMTQNLDLDLSPDLILTPDDTDIDRVWASSNTKKEIDYNQTDSYNFFTTNLRVGHMLTEVNGSYRYLDDYYEDIYGDNISECLIKYADNPKFCNHFRKGQDYSWLDAVAIDDVYDIVDDEHGVYTANESICPKGWRLPAGTITGSIYSSDFPKVIRTIIKEYDENGLLKVQGELGNNLIRPPYFFTSGYYWMSTLNQNNYAYYRYSGDSGSSFSYAGIDTTYKVRCMARPANSFTMEFSLNGGSGIAPDPLKGDSWTDSYTFQLPQIYAIPKKDGYNLIGWSTDPNATRPDVISTGMDSNGNNAIYTPTGQRATPNYTTTNRTTKMYAVWEKSINLKFNANGGKFSSYYSGESENEIKIAYSTPISGVTESETITYSSTDCNGSMKKNIDDLTTYCQGNQRSNTWSFGSEYDYIDVTIYYAVSGDSDLCVYDRTNNVYTSCDNGPISGNLADGAYFEASDHYLYTKHYSFPNNNGGVGIAFQGNSNSDGRTNWYGFWAEIKATRMNTDIQYLRSERRSPSAPTREGYRFVGWSTNPDATFVNWEYNSNLRYTEDVQLYAVWVECPIVTVAFTTNSSDHVQINTPTITWDTAKTITLQKNSLGQWQYYDSNLNDNVVIATVTASNDRFYTATSYISQQTLSTSVAKDLNEGDTYTVVIDYTQTPVENMHELTRESCSVAPLNTTQRMTDARDNKKYWVTKLADGNCWMTQNLDLEISTNGTTLVQETSNVSGSQTVYASSSWSTYASDNSYFNGANSYYANGVTPTSASSLSDDSELWHYHQGSYYNKKLSKMVCPAGWQLGNYRELFNGYGISQPKALVFSTVGNTPTQAPLYLIYDYSTPSSAKPSEDNNKYYTIYWSSSYFVRDIVTTYEYPTYSEYYNTPLVLYNTSSSANNLSAISNTDRYYREGYSVIYRTAGYVRCMR